MSGEAWECGVKFIESVSAHQYSIVDTSGEAQTYGKILLCKRALAERASSLPDLREQPYCRNFRGGFAGKCGAALGSWGSRIKLELH